MRKAENERKMISLKMISKCLSFSTVYTELPLIKMRMDVEGTGL